MPTATVAPYNMPTSSGYGYSGTGYGSLSRRTPPSTLTRGSSYDRGSHYTSTYSSSFKAGTGGRSLPPGPGPLDARGNRLSNYSVSPSSPSTYKPRAKPASTLTKNGPLRADHDSFRSKDTYTSKHDSYTSKHDTYASKHDAYTSKNDAYVSSSRYTGTGGVHVPASSTSGRLSSGRRSASLADLSSTGLTSRSRQPASELVSYNSNYSSGQSRDDHSSTGLSRRTSNDREPYRYRAGGSRDYSPLGGRERSEGTSRPSPSRLPSVDGKAESPAKSLSRQSSASSSSSVVKYEGGGKVGLSNLGNTCFMNSVLQCLSNTKPLLLYCLKDDYHLDINATSSSMRGALFKAYVNLMHALWKDKRESYVSPNAFKTQIQKFAPRFMGYAQQDAQEFLRYLLEGLHEDVNRVTNKPRPIILDDDVLEKKNDAEKAQDYWKAYLTLDNSRIVEIFVGQLKSELKFSSCKHRSVTFDPFWDLSLPIPKGRSEVSLDDCLRLFMKEEELEDEERPVCAKCKTRRSCTKSFSIHKFPPILVLHLKRFSQERFGRKLSTMVDYPVTGLDLSKYAAEQGGGRVLYNLYGVSFHSGGAHSGHYTAVSRHPFTGEWHTFNDSRVSSARSNQAVSSEGYLLFYELAPGSAKL